MTEDTLRPGTKIRFVKAVEDYPECYAKRGEFGEVVRPFPTAMWAYIVKSATYPTTFNVHSDEFEVIEEA